MHAVRAAAAPLAGGSVVAAVAWRARALAWAVPVGLLLLGAGVRAWAASQVPFPVNEGSASYVEAARNLVEQRGLVSDAIWSYATPPLVLPKPAFELWMPMASFLAAIPMSLLEPTFRAAQLSSVLLGAAIGPITWWLARDAATRKGLDDGRVAAVALGGGLVASILGPFLIAAAVPDSTAPFLLFGTLAAIATSRVLARPTVPAGVVLGILLGLAYLSRQEAVYLGLVYLGLATAPLWRATRDRSQLAARLVLAPILGGLAVVGPWLIRNLAAFGTLFPGQALENVYLTRNEEIFAYAERPTSAAFLDQGVPTIVSHQLTALWHDLAAVIVLPALPVGIIGVLAALALRRSPALGRQTALGVLLLGGAVTYLATSLLLPVATLWGTFMHAAGPLLVGLTVAAMLGLDAGLARIGRMRRWSRPNAWLATVVALSVAAPLTVLQIDVLGRQAATQEARLEAVATRLEALPEIQAFPVAGSTPSLEAMQGAALISDHPVWLAAALRRPVIALPDEPPEAIAGLAADFGTRLVVIMDERGRYPQAWLTGDAAACLAQPPERIASPTGDAWLVRLASRCGHS